jgi:hypothetical protein
LTMGKPYAKEGPSAEDKALDLFADMMIERIQSLSGKDGWKKPLGKHEVSCHSYHTHQQCTQMTCYPFHFLCRFCC